LSEWHITPDYIENHWTDELLNLMIEKLEERKEKEHMALSGHGDGDNVSDTELFKQLGNKVKVKKKWQ